MCYFLVQFVAEAFQPRDRSTHASHCSALNGDLHDYYATTYGINRDSLLNTSKFFHVTEGLVPDIMHDCLEGCLPYEVKELLKHLIQCGVITLPMLNDTVQSFPYQGSDASNKPSIISSSTISSSDHGLRQTGTITFVVVIIKEIAFCCIHKFFYSSIVVVFVYAFSFSDVVSCMFTATDDWA